MEIPPKAASRNRQGEPILITTAFAQAAGAPTAATPSVTEFITNTPIVPLVLVVAIMYFLIIRPQQKRSKEHANLLKNIRRGDSIVTNGGLIGKISRVVDDAEIELEIAPNVKVRVARSMISEVRTKGEPVKDQA
jgi:preprotein translocase subunit YajC